MALSKIKVNNLTKKVKGISSFVKAAYKDASPQQKKALNIVLNKTSQAGSVLAKCPKPGQKKACSTAGKVLRYGATSSKKTAWNKNLWK